MTKRVPSVMMRDDRMEKPVTEAAMEPPLQEFELPTNDIPLNFYGWLVGELDNGGGDRLRWAVLQLYRWQPRDGGPLGYVLYTIGHSVVYHEPDSACGKGVAVTVGNIESITSEPFEDLMACPECGPEDLADLDDDDEVEMERTWYKWVKCADDDDLLLALRKEPKCKRCFHRPHAGHVCATCRCETYEEAERPISSPGARLLALVRPQLPSLIEAMNEKKVRL